MGAAAYLCLFLAIFPECVLVCLYARIHSGIAHSERKSDLPSSSAELLLAWQCSSLSNLKALYVCTGFPWVSHKLTMDLTAQEELSDFFYFLWKAERK